MIARDTDTFNHAHRGIRKTLLENCSDPDLLKVLLDSPMRLPDTPCILYTRDDGKRHVDYPERKTFKDGGFVLVSVSRAAFAIARQNSRDHLKRDEEALHSCGVRGDNATGIGCCINPHHIHKGTEDTRVSARVARANLKKTFPLATPNEILCTAQGAA